MQNKIHENYTRKQYLRFPHAMTKCNPWLELQFDWRWKLQSLVHSLPKKAYFANKMCKFLNLCQFANLARFSSSVFFFQERGKLATINGVAKFIINPTPDTSWFEVHLSTHFTYQTSKNGTYRLTKKILGKISLFNTPQDNPHLELSAFITNLAKFV